LYLEPLFASPDILQQMPREGALFLDVDKSFRRVMASAQAKPKVLDATQGQLKLLQRCNAKLDELESGLHRYLETKRLAFPRFFFLSNDELLEILSETRNPLRVQPFVKKCFEGIQELQFQVEAKTADQTCVPEDIGSNRVFITRSLRVPLGSTSGKTQRDSCWFAALHKRQQRDCNIYARLPSREGFDWAGGLAHTPSRTPAAGNSTYLLHASPLPSLRLDDGSQ
jgi:hypothetical protein